MVQEFGTFDPGFKVPYIPSVRPLFHPAAADLRPEAILHALADPVRAAIFAGIAGVGHVRACAMLQGLAARPIPKSSLSQHVRVLREAGLIRSERHGVEMRNESRCAEVDARFPGLLGAILGAYGAAAGRAPAR